MRGTLNPRLHVYALDIKAREGNAIVLRITVLGCLECLSQEKHSFVGTFAKKKSMHLGPDNLSLRVSFSARAFYGMS